MNKNKQKALLTIAAVFAITCGGCAVFRKLSSLVTGGGTTSASMGTNYLWATNTPSPVTPAQTNR